MDDQLLVSIRDRDSTHSKKKNRDHRLDFVSTRSPVWKERPLPRSKKEAIDLMMEQPNLIKRPILIKGSKVIFGFNKEQYNGL